MCKYKLLKNLSNLIKEVIANVFHRDDVVLAISTGTPSPFRKLTAMIMDSGGKVLGYAKIGETSLAIKRIKNEAKTLKLLVNSYQLSGNRNQEPGISNQESAIRYPECLYEGEIENVYVLIQSPAPFEGKSGDSEFNESYADVLRVLIEKTSVKKKFVESNFYKNLKTGVENYPLSYKDLLKDALKYLEDKIGDKEILFSLSHGDFAPWNMVWSKDRKEVFIYDWESANPEAPTGIDLVHFLFQTGFLLKKLRGENLLKYIARNPFLSISLLSPEILILLYSLYMAVTEDAPQQLSPPAVERRKMIKTLVGRR